ncbi:MAG TPA: ParB/RepB/Spo0J family partition protein [Gemmatimonadaceae bacterium]|nr:ParB/RepB/Spo0J family partition protein [Gemmatimonadaceae bacterium]
MSAETPRRLGRGLEALIPAGGALQQTAATSDLQRIQISRIRPNPFQPRREIDAAELVELEQSLKSSGLLQPITVRRRGDAFELIAGERRFRAASNLGWSEISAIVRDFDDRTMLVLALVENLQRADLNAIEEARGYRRLIEDFQLTQQQVAEAVGKDRTTVTNLLRILSLPEEVQQLVQTRALTSGHARALLGLAPEHSTAELAKRAVAAGMSVRALEQLVRTMSAPVPIKPDSASAGSRTTSPRASAAVRAVEDALRRYLQTDVRIAIAGEEKGTVELKYYSNDDLDRLLALILREKMEDFSTE